MTEAEAKALKHATAQAVLAILGVLAVVHFL